MVKKQYHLHYSGTFYVVTPFFALVSIAHARVVCKKGRKYAQNRSAYLGDHSTVDTVDTVGLCSVQWIPLNRDRFLQPKISQLTDYPD